MSTKKRKAVIEFTAKMTKNAEVIFNAPNFELEEGLVLIKRSTNKKQDKVKKVVFDIVFGGKKVGMLLPIPKEENNSIGLGACRVRLYDHVFGYSELEQTLANLITSKNYVLEIVTLDEVNMILMIFMKLLIMVLFCVQFIIVLKPFLHKL